MYMLLHQPCIAVLIPLHPSIFFPTAISTLTPFYQSHCTPLLSYPPNSSTPLPSPLLTLFPSPLLYSLSSPLLYSTPFPSPLLTLFPSPLLPFTILDISHLDWKTPPTPKSSSARRNSSSTNSPSLTSRSYPTNSCQVCPHPHGLSFSFIQFLSLSMVLYL